MCLNLDCELWIWIVDLKCVFSLKCEYVCMLVCVVLRRCVLLQNTRTPLHPQQQQHHTPSNAHRMLVDATKSANGSSFSGSSRPRCAIFLICFMRFLRCEDRCRSFL